ncbi:putative secondary metabolism biosynthetic enzyme [Curvularia kusanoi]|uniref:Secondary metabolism biosynthetic enzyme n=1 Tax=Curvularia kusanoi TaxID=90978 RepID=A0A9P4T4R8_CURKU|nr:putative secondary metabolism biosynthetic enzyme [Curvularia kusanoi]
MSTFNRPDIWLPAPLGAAQPYKLSQHRTLPSLVDFNATNNPEYLFAIQAEKGVDSETTLREISFAQLGRAIARCQAWLETTVRGMHLPVLRGGSVVKGPPIALLMESDVGLFIHQVALLGLGVPGLLLSARLSPAAVRKLLDTTGSKHILVSPRLSRAAREAANISHGEASHTVVYERQHYSYFLDDTTAVEPSYTSVCRPYYHSDETHRDAIILHSSGTTGFPKPIYQSHEYLVGFAACHALAKSEAETRNLSTLPLFHGFGVLAPCLSLSVGLTVCLPVNSIVSAATVIELLQATRAETMMTVPSVLDDLSHMDQELALPALRSLRFLAVGGGPIVAKVGEKFVSSGVRILNHFGATEVGALAPIFVPQKDYNHHYIRLRQDFDFKIEDVQGELGRCKLITFPFGWKEPFPIQDQLLRRPEAPDTEFRVTSRLDDVIVLATGEKVLPGIMESTLMLHPKCKAAVVVGHGRFEIGVLVEPKEPPSPEEMGPLVREIWELVQSANERADAHARVSSPQAIIVIQSGASLPRSDKGSVLRQEAYYQFKQQISEMYDLLDSSHVDSASSLDWSNLDVSIKTMIQERLRWKLPSNEWTIDDDLFELGMDSLQALQLRRLLNVGAASRGCADVDNGFVYRNSSVSKLSKALLNDTEVSDSKQSFHQIEKFIQKYCPIPQKAGMTDAMEGNVVLVTGASGGLGSQLVQHLAGLSQVRRIICLARSTSVGNTKEKNLVEELRISFAKKNITIPANAWLKIDVLQADFSKPLLGLNPSQYNEISSQITHIIHNGWPMDFNRHVGSFEGQFRLTRELIQLGRETYSRNPPRKPTFLFVSSIAAAGRYCQERGEWIVPEGPMPDARCADFFGYAQAKLVCERIVEHSARMYGTELVAKYVRVGQMTGARATGMWNPTEHFPALVKSSQHLGVLPQLGGTLSWLPLDVAAECIVDILFSGVAVEGNDEGCVYHLENPMRQPWEEVLSIIASELGIVSRLPYRDWVTAMSNVPDEQIEQNPAKKMAKFFVEDFESMSSGRVVMGTERTRRVSKTLRTVGPLDADLIREYVHKWVMGGFLGA